MRRFLAFAALLGVAFILSCQDQAAGPLGPDGLGPQFAKEKNCDPEKLPVHPSCKDDEPSDEPSIVADFRAHADAGFPLSSSLLVTTCPGTATASFAVSFGHSQCLIVSPTWTSLSFGPYTLTDDIFFAVKRLKGEIAQVRLTGQDIIGPGIMHETDKLPVDPRVPTSVPTAETPFTFHVHMDGVAVYRLSGHLAGKRVEQIGTISIADVVYRVAP